MEEFESKMLISQQSATIELVWSGYFQLAQPIRLLLAYVGEEVEEKRYQCGPGKI